MDSVTRCPCHKEPMTKGEYLKLKGIKYISGVNPEEIADEDFRRLIDALVEREGIEPGHETSREQ